MIQFSIAKRFSNFFINKMSLKIGLMNDVKYLGNNNDKEYTALLCNILKSFKPYFLYGSLYCLFLFLKTKQLKCCRIILYFPRIVHTYLNEIQNPLGFKRIFKNIENSLKLVKLVYKLQEIDHYYWWNIHFY